jgi:hypothetical protein
MQQVNLHQRKLYALVEAIIAFIALLLPWTSYKITLAFNFFGGGDASLSIPPLNGLRSWGFVTLIGIVGVIICSLMGDKLKEYDKNMRLAVMASFGAIALGAIAYLLTLNSAGPLEANGNPVTINAGFGLWIALIAGLIGLVWVSGVLDQVMKKPAAATPRAK